jgi:hypothetical protein
VRRDAMTFSSTDFSDEIICTALQLGWLTPEQVQANELEVQQRLVTAEMIDSNEVRKRANDAVQFHDELLQSVETLTGIAEEHGTVALANVNYLQTAILKGSAIELASTDKGQIAMFTGLPSGDRWMEHVTIVD